jgi:hypothetical protein
MIKYLVAVALGAGVEYAYLTERRADAVAEVFRLGVRSGVELEAARCSDHHQHAA